MKLPQTVIKAAVKSLAIAALVSVSGISVAEPLPALVDNFDNPANNNLGIQRQLITDSMSGGASTAAHNVEGGVVTVKGDIAPARGQLGWASFVLPLDAQGAAQDAAAYQGVLLKVKVIKGNLSVSVNSTDVTNFDYHATPVVVANDGEFHNVKLPFDSLKRAWSEPTPLNPETVNAISIVAYGVQPESFNFEVDEVKFY